MSKNSFLQGVGGLWYSIRRTVYHFRWIVIKLSWHFFKDGTRKAAIINSKYTIGVTTYIDRYERFLQPLMRHLVSIFPDTQITVAINGYHDQGAQRKYLAEVTTFLNQFSNVKIIAFEQPQSLSKLWNLIILNSVAHNVFVLNDDIQIGPKLRSDLDKSGILNERVALMNESWSHFLISKDIVNTNGWFDERFPAIGNEDEDYECRLAFHEITVKSFKIRNINNIVYKTNNYSWDNADIVNTKYIRTNQVFFNSKWDIKNQPEQGYRYVRILDKYVRLKPGMETPSFYPVPCGPAP